MKKDQHKKLIDDLKGEGENRRVALRAIYAKNYPKILKMITQKGGQEADAQDIFQDSMIILHKMILENKFREEANVGTLLYAIARNLWHQKVREKRYTEDVSVLNEYYEEINFEWAEFTKEKVIHQLIDELPYECQQVLHMFYFEQKSMREIQEAFKLGNINSAKNKKYRCVQNLIEIFKKKGIKPSSF